MLFYRTLFFSREFIHRSAQTFNTDRTPSGLTDVSVPHLEGYIKSNGGSGGQGVGSKKSDAKIKTKTLYFAMLVTR